MDRMIEISLPATDPDGFVREILPMSPESA